MRKFLLTAASALLIGLPAIKAQQPDAIYFATWTTMSDLGKPITPNDNDPKLTFNSATGCYEGEVLDWPKLAVNPYNAKIPYSVNDGEITYYGVDGTTQQFIFNTLTSCTLPFQPSTSPAKFKGYGLSSANNNSIESVKVSMNFDTKEITFTQFQSDQSTVLPKLVSIVPENGSTIKLNEDGGTSIVLTFDAPVTSMDVLSEDNGLKGVPSNDGKVWTIDVPANTVNASTSENQGKLVIKIQKVYAGNLPVGFDGGSQVINLSYDIEGLTTTCTLNFTGDQGGLNTLYVYRAPEYTVGDNIDFDDNTLISTFRTDITYLITVGSGYSINITSTIDSANGQNWSLGEAYSTEKGENGASTGKVSAYGTTITLYPGANGAVFTVNVTKGSSGVGSIVAEDAEEVIYNLQGQRVTNPTKGLYIINGKKVLVP